MTTTKTNIKGLFLIIIIVPLLITCSPAHQNTSTEIHAFIDKWHDAARDGNIENFFEKMSNDFHYIGTQHDEVWNKADFKEFCTPHFTPDGAWEFKSIQRNLHSTKDKQLYWFDETLETWMGVCRGTGVLAYENDSLKLKHYCLSVTIANDQIKEFIQIAKRDSINSFIE